MDSAAIITTKSVFEQIINVVGDIHKRIAIIDMNTTVQHCLRELYTLHKNAETGCFGKQYYNRVINEMCNYVNAQCNANKTDIYETWVKIVFDADITKTSQDKVIYTHLRNFFLGDMQIYEIKFELKDRRTGYGRYYYVFKIAFDENLRINVSIQDLHTHNCKALEKGLAMINGSYLSDDGYISFSASNNTLLDLAKYCYQEFDNHGFQGGFELYPKLSLSVRYNHYEIVNKNVILQDYFDDYLVSNNVNNRFMDILIPF